jgi:hypothetical protein
MYSMHMAIICEIEILVLLQLKLHTNVRYCMHIVHRMREAVSARLPTVEAGGREGGHRNSMREHRNDYCQRTKHDYVRTVACQVQMNPKVLCFCTYCSHPF